MASTPPLEVRSLRKSFGKTVAVADVDLTLPAGEVVALIAFSFGALALALVLSVAPRLSRD